MKKEDTPVRARAKTLREFTDLHRDLRNLPPGTGTRVESLPRSAWERFKAWLRGE